MRPPFPWPLALLVLALAAPGSPAAGPPTSTVVVPLSVRLDSLFAKLATAAPSQAAHLDSWAELPPGSGYAFRYSWKRTPFVLAAEGMSLTARTRVSYQVRAALRQARPWPFKDGFVHIPLGSVGFDGDGPLDADFLLSAALSLGPDWKLRSKTRVEPTFVDRTRVTPLRIDVTRFVAAAAQAELDKAAARIDAEVPARVDLRTPAEKLWKRLSQPIRLGRGDTWLVLRPQALGASPIEGQGNLLGAKLSLTASPEIVVGKAPVLPALALPALAAVDAPPGFRLAMRARLDPKAASTALGKLLAGKSFPVPGLGALGVKGATVALDGARMVVRLATTGAVEGELVLAGTPRPGGDGGLVEIPDLDYEAKSSGVLARLGDWVGHAALRDQLRRSVRIGFADATARLAGAVETMLAAPLQGGTRLTGELGAIRVESLEPRGGSLDATLVVTGSLSALVP